MKRTTLAVLAVLAATLHPLVAGDADAYSWNTPHALPTAQGALKWNPKPFVFVAGSSVRYIDFERGDDNQPGDSREHPWQHHPWDAAATGKAKAGAGPHTYVFKRGVDYRGQMFATDAGDAKNPIRLTSDPSWGKGEARILGSQKIAGGWKRGTAADAPGIPEPEKVWFIDIDKKIRGSALWMVDGNKVTRMNIAREPNWTITDPDHPTANWWLWQTFNGFSGAGTIADPVHLAGKQQDFYNGVDMWTQHATLMGSPHRPSIKDYNSTEGSFKIGSPGGASYLMFWGSSNGKAVPFKTDVRYYLENLPAFLDAPGEYWYDRTRGRLFVRLDPGVDPNRVAFEISRYRHLIEIRDQSHIEISGLTFSYNEEWDGKYGYPWYIGTASAVRLVGRCNDITVANCNFFHVMSAIVAFPRPNGGNPGKGWATHLGPWDHDVMDGITVRDNDVAHVDQAGAIWIYGNSEMEGSSGAGFGVLKRVDVLRNRVVDTGFRPGFSPTSNIPAIEVIAPETCEIAGNIVDTSWGSGIFVLGGKHNGAVNEVLLTRILVHHNQVENSMLGCNDYGGLEIFQGGPAYFYDNVSRNAVGTRTFNGIELGYDLYLDGAFKVASFNNILDGRWHPGQKPTYSFAGYLMVFGFLDHFFNNTVHQVQYPITGSSGNRSCVLGNLVVDSAKEFLMQNRPGDASMMGGGDTGEMGRQGIPTMSYGNNVFFGKPVPDKNGKVCFGQIGGMKLGEGADMNGKAEQCRGATIEELRAALEKMQARVSSIGWHVDTQPLRDAAGRDFSLANGSPAIGRGVKFFLPWGLSSVVGEWNFYQSVHNPGVVLDEHFYMQPEHVRREMYYFIPRFDLNVTGATADSYVQGVLEDWIPGALHFDGKVTRAVLTHAEMMRDTVYPGKGGSNSVIPGSQRKTLDMSDNNFLIEVVLRTAKGHAGGAIAGKTDDKAGYLLGLDKAGCLELSLSGGGKTAVIAGPKPVNDGDWHHLLVEVDRKAGQARMHIDGKTAQQAAIDLGDASLANAADFVVGAAGSGRFFAGDIDFLRVSRGTLADAKTTIAELFAWEFDGPFLRDFAGRTPKAKRDAGALQSASN